MKNKWERICVWMKEKLFLFSQHTKMSFYSWNHRWYCCCCCSKKKGVMTAKSLNVSKSQKRRRWKKVYNKAAAFFRVLCDECSTSRFFAAIKRESKHVNWRQLHIKHFLHKYEHTHTSRVYHHKKCFYYRIIVSPLNPHKF